MSQTQYLIYSKLESYKWFKWLFTIIIWNFLLKYTKIAYVMSKTLQVMFESKTKIKKRERQILN